MTMLTTPNRSHTTTTDAMDQPSVRPFGATSRTRQIAGALTIMAGAIPIALIAPTYYGRPPRLWSVMIAIGVVGLIGWLADGRRYVGAASASLAIGAALGIAAEFDLGRYTYALLFGFLGVALLSVFRVNPRAIIGSVGLLFFASASAALLHLTGVGAPDPQPTIPQAWAYVPLMIVWGLVVLRQIHAEKETGPAPSGDRASVGAHSSQA